MRVYDANPLLRGDGAANRDQKCDSIQVYKYGSEQALLAKKNGRCYVSFRGLDIWNIRDIYSKEMFYVIYEMFVHKEVVVETMTTLQQRLRMLHVLLNNNTTDCCQTRAPIWVGYNTNFRQQLENDIINCKQSCKGDPKNFLYLTGYSSGGGIAQVAAVMLQDAKANVIAFGTEPTLNPECGAPIRNPSRVM